jgi:hypothetical protein
MKQTPPRQSISQGTHHSVTLIRGPTEKQVHPVLLNDRT